MDEETRILLNKAIVDCFYIADLIISELPDMPKIELLDQSIKTALTYNFCQICEKSESKRIIMKSLKDFRENVQIDPFNRQEFVENIIFEVLGESWK